MLSKLLSHKNKKQYPCKRNPHGGIPLKRGQPCGFQLRELSLLSPLLPKTPVGAKPLEGFRPVRGLKFYVDNALREFIDLGQGIVQENIFFGDLDRRAHV
eukprot:TRINITY_DN23822_c0_g1_i3.p4 TRINITY_DN23822_c0_g1~~TRINITY_DN23822_c0_g1_i3.p4  ORF type:complete len:100 (+),score=8.02 TRINITY_DN23822_c0_g1_i3:793-1092(+)